MRNRKDVKKIGIERVKMLFREAEEAFRNYPERSHRYVEMALKIAAKTGIRIPRDLKRRYCRKCRKYLVSGANARYRTREGKLTIYCFNCKKYRRILLNTKS